MFRRRVEIGEAVEFTFDGRPLTARRGDTVAAALLAAGIETCRRSVVSASPHAPYCLMGVCFECLVVIDGIGNRQACLVPVADGMAVKTQEGPRHPVPDPAEAAP
jgi:D-hydroxyproline dehydrogenase subunit gamma